MASKRAPPKVRPPKPAHRPSKYTPQLAERLTSAIAVGDTVNEACKRVGINPDTFYEWVRVRPEFADAVQAAKTARLDVLEERWAKATLKDWRAAEAMLRVLKPKQFAQRLRVHVEAELDSVLDALTEAFGEEPQTLERALQAVVSRGRGGAEVPPAPEAPAPPPEPPEIPMSERSDNAVRPAAESVPLDVASAPVTP